MQQNIVVTVKHETGNNRFHFFSTIFSIYLQLQESKYISICEMWLFDLFFFLKSANLIYQGTDVSKYFWETLGLRDNEIRLYFEIRPRKRCRLFILLFFPYCSAERNHLCSFGTGAEEEYGWNYFQIMQLAYEEMSFKFRFLFLARVAILFGGAKPF